MVARGCHSLAPGCWAPVAQLQAAAFSDGVAAGWHLATAGAEDGGENTDSTEMANSAEKAYSEVKGYARDVCGIRWPGLGEVCGDIWEQIQHWFAPEATTSETSATAKVEFPSVRHDVECKKLWSVVNKVMPAAKGRPAAILGLRPPSESQVHACMLAARIYHDVKIGHAQLVQGADRTAARAQRRCAIFAGASR